MFSKYKVLMKYVAGVCMLVPLVIIAQRQLNHELFITLIKDISAFHLIVASLGIVGVMALSTSRFKFINNKLGGNEDWLFLHRVNLLSMLYSQIALPLIAQILGRVAHGSLESKQNYAPITVLEKSISFSIMVGLGTASAFIIFNQNIIPSGLISALVLLGGAIVTTAITCLVVFFNAAERNQILKLLFNIIQIGVLRVIGISLSIQVFILLIYTVIALQFVPNVDLVRLICAFAIVVLATAVPIGFGGWGVREGAAAGVFFALGMPPEIGILVGLIYGLLHLLILVITILVLRNKTVPIKASSFPNSRVFQEANFWPFTFFLIVVLLPFQIRLPVGSGLITLNAADILALVVMINFTIIQMLTGKIKFIWYDRIMWFGIAGVILMLMVGWIVGYLRFGSNEWATGNRLMGIIIILSYLFTGAAMQKLINQVLIQKIAFLLAFSIVMSVIIQLVVNKILGFESPIFFNWSKTLHGFIADKNAFCFMAALSAVLLIFSLSFSLSEKRNNTYAVILLSILISLMMLTSSRSGFGAAAVLFVWMLVFLPRFIPTMIIGPALVFVVLKLSNLIAVYPTIPDFERVKTTLFNVGSQRISLNSYGYEMFLSNPFLGGGLGASIEKNGLVIHNLYLWILGEMGLMGVVLSLPLIIAFFRTGCRVITGSEVTWTKNTNLHGYALFIIICGGFSLFQDVAYQRILWLLVGFMMAQQTKNYVSDRQA